jgi:hypothetical protein
MTTIKKRDTDGAYLFVFAALRYNPPAAEIVPAEESTPDCLILPVTPEYACALAGRVSALRALAAAGPLAGATLVTIPDARASYHHLRDVVALFDDDTLGLMAERLDTEPGTHAESFLGVNYYILPGDTPLERLTPVAVDSRETEVSSRGVLWAAWPRDEEVDYSRDRMWTQLLEAEVIESIAGGEELPAHLFVRRGGYFLPDRPERR